MKRVLLITLVLIMLLSLFTGCESEKNNIKQTIFYDLCGDMEMRDDDGNLLISIKDVAAVYYSKDLETSNEYFVGVIFTEDGKNKFATTTSTYFGKHISVFVENELVGKYEINCVITNGKAIIKRSLTMESAKELVQKIVGNQ